ncbi:ADP-ribosylglycohydrolase [Aureococcus anophagefferens]|uniref:ADP-ribosylglycohydrolase n=1 Tax=Aureococcus anophagefferens TaxID=44056 RepID=A0ABR1FJH3_AURAN
MRWAGLLFVCGASGNKDCAATTGAKNCAAPPPEMSKGSKDRVQGALWGLLAGDALASPTHWYYGGLRQVQGDYGRQGIRDYTKPVAEMQGSIMPRSNTDGAGRGSYNEDRTTVIGDVINHGKKPYWNPRTSFHYHGTLAAGENTLEAQLSRLLVRTIAARGGVDDAAFRDAYVAWMTTPGSHNDSYASTCHRMFFANYAHGKRDPADCPDNDRHNVDTIDGLVLPSVAAVAAAYGGGPGARAEAVDAAVRVARQSLPSALAMAKKYGGDDVFDALLVNANVGGENVHRGAVLGALLGANKGRSRLPPRLVDGLAATSEIAAEIDALVAALAPK